MHRHAVRIIHRSRSAKEGDFAVRADSRAANEPLALAAKRRKNAAHGESGCYKTRWNTVTAGDALLQPRNGGM
jgi:hypothetical protein